MHPADWPRTRPFSLPHFPKYDKTRPDPFLARASQGFFFTGAGKIGGASIKDCTTGALLASELGISNMSVRDPGHASMRPLKNT